jgi:hypothetical protein
MPKTKKPQNLKISLLNILLGIRALNRGFDYTAIVISYLIFSLLNNIP